jgi:pyridoxamine 5'-phosphate oxidase
VNGRELELRREDLADGPAEQYRRWFDAAADAGVPLPEACAVATADAAGRPSVRMVLLKDVDERGFVWATNYTSRKARELAENDRAAVLVYWHALGRQVRAEGRVERLTAAESDAIFLARPRASRISAIASRQSEPIASREELEARVRELESALEGREVERPDFWGGYRLVPDAVEFWQHRADRLHVRFLYRRAADGWDVVELQP